MADAPEDIPTKERILHHWVEIHRRVDVALHTYVESVQTTPPESRALMIAAVAVLSQHLRTALDGALKLGVPNEVLEASSALPLSIIKTTGGGAS